MRARRGGNQFVDGFLARFIVVDNGSDADCEYAIAAGLRDRAIAPAITGMLLGCLAITVVVAAGIGALVTSAPATLSALTVIGAGSRWKMRKIIYTANAMRA